VDDCARFSPDREAAADFYDTLDERPVYPRVPPQGSERHLRAHFQKDQPRHRP